MTISLNPLFASTSRQSQSLVDEGAVSDSANPFAELLAAQMQSATFMPPPGRGDATAFVDGKVLSPADGRSAGLAAAGELLTNQASVFGQDAEGLIEGAKPALASQAVPKFEEVAGWDPATQGQAREQPATRIVGVGESGTAAMAANNIATQPAGAAIVTMAMTQQGRQQLVKDNASIKADKETEGRSKGIGTRLPAAVAELVSQFASAIKDPLAKEMSGPATMAPGRTVADAVSFSGVSLKDKGFAVRVEAEMALSANGREGGGGQPVALQSSQLQAVAGGSADAATTFIAQPMSKADAWGEAFGKQLVSTVSSGLDKTTIQVNPEHLGPLEISISMNKDQAQVMVVAANPQARDIVEHHLPALSRMMEQAGLQLTDAQVSSQQQGQQQGQEQGRRAGQLRQEVVPEVVAVDEAVQEPIANGLKIQV